MALLGESSGTPCSGLGLVRHCGYSQEGPVRATLVKAFQHPIGPFAALSYSSGAGTQERSPLTPLSHP